MLPLVLARAHGGRPLKRLAIGEGARVWYLLNPDAADDPARLEEGGVGFPKEDCFVWDAAAFARLEDVYAKTGATAGAEWDDLTRFRMPVPA